MTTLLAILVKLRDSIFKSLRKIVQDDIALMTIIQRELCEGCRSITMRQRGIIPFADNTGCVVDKDFKVARRP